MITWALRGIAGRMAPYVAGFAILGALVLWGTIERQRASVANARAEILTTAYSQLSTMYAAAQKHAETINELRREHDRETETLAQIKPDACIDAALPADLARLLNATQTAADAGATGGKAGN